MTMMGPGDDLRLLLKAEPIASLICCVSAGFQETVLGNKVRANYNRVKFTGDASGTMGLKSYNGSGLVL